MADHPLVPWLKRRKLKPYRFADQIEMPRRTLYAHLSGKVRNPSLEAMRAIEKGTDGKVSLKAQDGWFAALAPQDEAEEAEPVADEAEEPDEVFDDNDDPRESVEP